MSDRDYEAFQNLLDEAQKILDKYPPSSAKSGIAERLSSISVHAEMLMTGTFAPPEVSLGKMS